MIPFYSSLKTKEMFIELSTNPFATLILHIFIFAFALPVLASQQAIPDPSPEKSIDWTRLSFYGSKMGSDIHLQIVQESVDKISKNTSEEGETKKLTIKSSSKTPGLKKRRYEEYVLFNESTLHPYMRSRTNGAHDRWEKKYFWESEGVRREKRSPANSKEEKQSSDNWTKQNQSFYKHPQEIESCTTVSDLTLLVYILSQADSVETIDSKQICMFGKKQLHQVTIQQGVGSPIQVSYTRHASSGKTDVREQVTPIIYSISGKSFTAKKKNREPFAVMGLHKNIQIYTDPKNGLPLRISGENNRMGMIILELTELSQ